MRCVIIALVLCLLAGGCEPDSSANENADQPAQPAFDALVFPGTLRAAEPAVNEVIEKSMHACLEGNYDGFRLLWSVEVEPISRALFLKSFQFVQKIEIKALAEDPDPDRLGYAVYAEITFEVANLPADHPLRQEPIRPIVLLVIEEGDTWRLATAPGAVQKWMKQQVAGEAGGDPVLLSGGE